MGKKKKRSEKEAQREQGGIGEKSEETAADVQRDGR